MEPADIEQGQNFHAVAQGLCPFWSVIQDIFGHHMVDLRIILSLLETRRSLVGLMEERWLIGATIQSPTMMRHA